METQILQPTRTALKVKGKLAYREFEQAWNIIRLKKELLNEFPILKEKRSTFSYQMVVYRTYDELDKVVRKMKREKLPLPIFLFLEKEKNTLE